MWLVAMDVAPRSINLMEIGRQVKLLRMGCNKSQKEVAEAAGLQPSQLSRIESGKHDFKFSTLLPILEALGADLDLVLKKGRPINSAEIDAKEAKRKETTGVA